MLGWGKIKHPGSSHHILQQAHMPSVSHAECKRKNGNIGIQITDVMVCGGKSNTLISGCHGDSGGPYVCKNSAGRWVLQGDVSWGNPQCDSRQKYTVFGRVAKFRNWIDMHTSGGNKHSLSFKNWKIFHS
jgi:secreted trypsin-like serine protease